MSRPDLFFSQTIPASGPLVLRRSVGEVPQGYSPLGETWAIRLPPEFLGEGISRPQATIQLTAAVVAAGVKQRIDGFWSAAITALRPDPARPVPHSVEGTRSGSALSVPAPDEGRRAEQMHDYLRSRVTVRHSPQRPAFVDALMRQLAVLRLPSEGEARIWRDAAGDWVVQLHEAGGLAALFDRLVWSPGKAETPAKAAIQATLGKISLPHAPPMVATPRSRGGIAENAALITLARAVQIARIALACGPRADETLRIETGHADLDRKVLRLILRPAHRGLPLERLARRITRAFDQSIDLPPFEELLPFQPKLTTGSAPPEDCLAAPQDTNVPIRWQTATTGGRGRWLYAGTRLGDRTLAEGLPFALAPADAAALPVRGDIPSFHGLSRLDRAAYLDWIAGPRRSEGARPEFCHLYLQGLEFRLLSDTPDQEEIAPLLNEVAAIAGILPEGSPVRTAALTLLDWLTAEGRPLRDPMIAEGPLTCLVRLGRKVAQQGLLNRADLQDLARHLLPEDATGPDGLADGREEDLPQRISAPRLALVGRYRSLSGLCDVVRHVFREGETPLPDLRGSPRLLRLLEGRVAAQGTGGRE